MKLFAGLSGTDYQDILRAIGAFLDENHLVDIRIWEHEDGLIVQARSRSEHEGNAYQTYLLTDDDLRSLLKKAYERRNVTPRRM